MEEIRISKYQTNIMSAIDELQKCYRALNAKYFDNLLEDVVITIQSDTTRSAYAWISVYKVWKDNKECNYHEINIVAEFLNHDPKEVIAFLLHHMAHLYNLQNNIKDTSRGGTYHNQHFKEAAEVHGLNVEHNKKYGWTITSANVETIAWVEENVRKGCLRMKRDATWKDRTSKVTKGEDDSENPAIVKKGNSNNIKYICPKCAMIIRVSKNLDGKV